MKYYSLFFPQLFKTIKPFELECHTKTGGGQGLACSLYLPTPILSHRFEQKQQKNHLNLFIIFISDSLFSKFLNILRN